MKENKRYSLRSNSQEMSSQSENQLHQPGRIATTPRVNYIHDALLNREPIISVSDVENDRSDQEDMFGMDQEADKVESDTKDSQDLELATPPRPKRRSPYATPGNHHSRWKPRRNTAQNRPDANPGPSRSRNLAAKYKGYPAMLLDRISAIMAAIYCATNANSRTTTVSLKSIHRSHHEIKLTSTLTSVGARDALIPRKLLDNVAGVIYCFSGFLLDAIDKGVGVLSAYPDATSASYKRLARDSVHPMTDEIRNEMWIRISAVTNSLIKKWTSCLKTSRSNGIMCATEYASASCTPVVPCLDDWVDNPIWNLHHGPGSGVEQLWDDVMTETCPQHLSALARTQVTHDDFKQVARPVIKYVLSQLLRELEAETGLDLFARGPMQIPRRAELQLVLDDIKSPQIVLIDLDTIADGIPVLISDSQENAQLN